MWLETLVKMVAYILQNNTLEIGVNCQRADHYFSMTAVNKYYAKEICWSKSIVDVYRNLMYIIILYYYCIS